MVAREDDGHMISVCVVPSHSLTSRSTRRLASELERRFAGICVLHLQQDRASIWNKFVGLGYYRERFDIGKFPKLGRGLEHNLHFHI